MYPPSHQSNPKYAQHDQYPMDISGGHPHNPPFISATNGGATPWSTGLCHCCDDPGNCFVTCVCPCVTFGQIAEIVDQGSSTCPASGAVYALRGCIVLSCLYSCFYRSKLRGQYDLEEAPCVDCLVHFLCEPCALCQEYRELKIRGFDMGIGWQANMDRRSRGITVAPVIGGGMTR